MVVAPRSTTDSTTAATVGAVKVRVTKCLLLQNYSGLCYVMLRVKMLPH